MANITIPPHPKTTDKQIDKFIEACIRAIRQLKAEVERLEKEKQDV